MAGKYGFPPANKTLQREERDRAYRMHRRKVHDMKAGLDTSEPRRYPHLVLRLKQTQTEEEYLTRIDHENKLLLKKMMKIMETPRNGGMNNWNERQGHRSLNEPFKVRQAKKIELENLAIARRLEKVGPIYSTQKWEEDHKKHLYLLDLLAENRDTSPRGKGKQESRATTKAGDDQYEDDFESDDEDKKKEKLPEIQEQETEGEGQRRSSRCKSQSSVQPLPKIRGYQQDPKLFMYYGRWLGVEPEQKEKKGDGKAASQAEKDAKHLFRVVKMLSPATDIFIRTLIRRTPEQRQKTKEKFKELYDLDLVTQLKKGLSKEWDLLIDALLPDPEGEENDDDDKRGSKRKDKKEKDNKRDTSTDKEKDKDKTKDNGSHKEEGPEETLHNALMNGDIPGAVTIISALNEKQLVKLKQDYQKEYTSSLETDIERKTEDPEQLFLLTLVKEKKKKAGGQKEDATKEATAIYEQGEGRWSAPGGHFISLLETSTNAHVRAVLNKYKQVSGGTTAVEAIEKDCSKSYSEAVAAFMKSKGQGKGQKKDKGQGKGQKKGKGHGSDDESDKEEDSSDDPKDCAALMYSNLNPTNSKFVYTLVERAEVDMPKVRRAYSKKYKSELHEDLEGRHGNHPTTVCLTELVLKEPNKGKDQDKDSSRKRSHDHSQGHRKGDDQGQGQGQKKGHDGKKDGDQSQREQQKKQGDKKDDKKKKDGGDAKADEDAEKLHKAMDGLGTDEDTILDIIIKRSNAQRQTLKKKYKEKYKKELAEDLKSELSGDFEEVILGLLMPPVHYDAHCLHTAVKGLGTNEDVLIGILCTANAKELSSVKERYKKAYGEDLESAVRGDTSGGFADLLTELTKGQREQGSNVNEKEAKEDAEKLYKGPKAKLDMKDEALKNLMTKKNKEQVKATSAEYKKLSGKSLEDAIKKAASGDTEAGYIGLLGALDDPVSFYADSLQKAFKGMGTNDDQLIRIVVSRSEVDLPAIKAKFQERHGRPLRDAIESETSGDYRKALLKIVDKK